MRNLFVGLVAMFAAVGPIASAQAENARDAHSYARLDEVRVKHVYLDLDIAFERKRLGGFAELGLDWKKPDAKRLDLDTRDLTIERVSAQRAAGSWSNASFSLAKRDAKFGSHLTIRLKDAAPKVHDAAHGSNWSSLRLDDYGTGRRR